MPIFGSIDRGLDPKPELTSVTNTEEAGLGEPDSLDTEKNGTSRDQGDMARLGKKQQFNVRTQIFLSLCRSWLTVTSATSNSSQSLASVSQPFLRCAGVC